MILLLGAIGWGLFTAGALSHLSHLDRLEFLLTSHVGYPRLASRVLAGTEAAIALITPLAFFLKLSALLTVLAVFAMLVAAGFTVWVLRLLLSGSTLPCACSFSAAPTSSWSVLRAAATTLIGFFLLANNGRWAEDLATMITGVAVAMVIFVLPDALAWPTWARDMQDYAAKNPNPTPAMSQRQQLPERTS